MIIKIDSFRQGQLLLSLEAEVEGEASGHMLALAQESAKTSIMSALDSALAKGLAKGVKYERDAIDRAAFEAGLPGLKAPKNISGIKLAYVGAYEKKDGSVSDSALGKATMAKMRKEGKSEEVIKATCEALGVAYSLPQAANPPAPEGVVDAAIAAATPAPGESAMSEG